MARPISILELTSEEAQELKRRVQATTTSQRDHLRAQIVLLRAHGMKQHDVAETLGVSIVCVNKWSLPSALGGGCSAMGAALSRAERCRRSMPHGACGT